MTMQRTTRRLLASIAIGMGVGVAYTAVARWFRHWGASGPEVRAVLPGDELVENPTLLTTRAVTIAAPPEDIWPWLVQMGQDRGGLYSYDWLENLFGLEFRNAEQIVAGWQHLAVGDQIRAAPAKAGPDAGFTVAAIEPHRSIVTIVGDPARVLTAASTGPLADGATWAFVLHPLDDGTTRLIVRLRARFGLPPALEFLCTRLLEPVHFVMERKQLLGIKRRVELAAQTVQSAVQSTRSGRADSPETHNRRALVPVQHL